jgi:hypothetical protein
MALGVIRIDAPVDGATVADAVAEGAATSATKVEAGGACATEDVATSVCTAAGTTESAAVVTGVVKTMCRWIVRSWPMQQQARPEWWQKKQVPSGMRLQLLVRRWKMLTQPNKRS